MLQLKVWEVYLKCGGESDDDDALLLQNNIILILGMIRYTYFNHAHPTLPHLSCL